MDKSFHGRPKNTSISLWACRNGFETYMHAVVTLFKFLSSAILCKALQISWVNIKSALKMTLLDEIYELFKRGILIILRTARFDVYCSVAPLGTLDAFMFLNSSVSKDFLACPDNLTVVGYGANSSCLSLSSLQACLHPRRILQSHVNLEWMLARTKLPYYAEFWLSDIRHCFQLVCSINSFHFTGHLKARHLMSGRKRLILVTRMGYHITSTGAFASCQVCNWAREYSYVHLQLRSTTALLHREYCMSRKCIEAILKLYVPGMMLISDLSIICQSWDDRAYQHSTSSLVVFWAVYWLYRYSVAMCLRRQNLSWKTTKRQPPCLCPLPKVHIWQHPIFAPQFTSCFLCYSTFRLFEWLEDAREIRWASY